MMDDEVRADKALEHFLFEQAFERRLAMRRDDARSAFGGNAASLREMIKRREYRLADAIADLRNVLDQALGAENEKHFKPGKAKRYRHLLATLDSMTATLGLRGRPPSRQPQPDIVALLEAPSEWKPASDEELKALLEELGLEPPACLEEAADDDRGPPA